MHLKKIITGILLLLCFHLQAQQDSSFVYQKPLFDFDYTKPVLAIEKEVNSNLFLRYAMVTGYREGVRANNVPLANYNKEQKTMQVYWNNLSAKDLLMSNYLVIPGRVLFDVKDPSLYDYQPAYGDKTNWLRKNGYCFEYMLPAGANLSAVERQEFIEGILGLEGKWEMRKVTCYVIIRTSTANNLTPGGKTVPGVIERLEYASMGGTTYACPLPILNESGYGDGVGLKGEFLWKDIVTVRKMLQEEGLDIVEKVLETRMYVVKEMNR